MELHFQLGRVLSTKEKRMISKMCRNPRVRAVFKSGIRALDPLSPKSGPLHRKVISGAWELIDADDSPKM